MFLAPTITLSTPYGQRASPHVLDKDPHMPRIAPIETAHADPGVKATLSAVKTKIGMVPNLFSTFAQSPAVLDGYLAFSDALGKGVLTAKQREIIALAVSQANECHYCLSAHTLSG